MRSEVTAEFATFRLEGVRFDHPGMPAESVVEVAAYRDALFSVARELWLRANPGRQRVPSGFSEAIELRLTGVRSGSARPQLILARSPGLADDDLFDEYAGIFANARDMITEAVSTATAQDTLPNKFPRACATPLSKLGTSLGDSDRLTVGGPGLAGRRATLDNRFRATIKAIDDVLNEEDMRWVQREGSIVEYDSVSQSFKLRTDDGMVSCTFVDRDIAAIAKGYLSEDGIVADDVLVSAQTDESDDAKVRYVYNVSTITHVRSAGEKAIMNTIKQVSALKDGWHGDGSSAPAIDVLQNLESMATELGVFGSRLSVVPTPAGSIVLEWRTNAVEFTAEIEPDGRMFLCADDTSSNDLSEDERDFDREKFLHFVRTGEIGA